LLCEVLGAKGRAAIATVVLRQRQHLAAVLAHDDALVLEILRFAHELRPTTVAHGPVPSISTREREMAEALVDEMTTEWDPAKYHDSYRDDVLAMIEKKAKTGQAITSEPSKPVTPLADVSDLTALLRRSLDRTAPSAARKRAS
jgi:DNA end-binding protein Ku